MVNNQGGCYQHFLKGVTLKLDLCANTFPLTGSHDGDLVYFLSDALPPSGTSLFGLPIQGQNIRDKESFINMLKANSPSRNCIYFEALYVRNYSLCL